MKIVLVRHGTTVSNNKNTYSEESTPLAEEAYTDLLVTKSRLAEFKFDKIYVSPLLRAVQTANVLGLKDFLLDERIQERDFGDFKGMTHAEVQAKFPEATKKWFSDPTHGKPPNGESMFEHYTRVADFMDEVSNTKTDTLIVCHYGTIALALAWVFGDLRLSLNFTPKNGGISEVKTDGKFHYISRFNY